MLEVVAWWLTIEVIGLACVPIAFVVLRNLPDRGYGASKPLGLLLVGYLVWALGWAQVLPNRRGSILLIVVGLAIASLVIVALRRSEFAEFLRRQWGSIRATELVFTGAFVLWAIIRAFNPQIAGTEQPMDFGFLNGVLRSEAFPPNDPWLAGYSISYYYFGYLIVAAVTNLSGIPSGVAYNLALATFFALSAAGAFSLVANFLPAARRSPHPNPLRAAPHPAPGEGVAGPARAPVAFALLAAVLVVGIGNLQGALDIVRANEVGSRGVWQWVGVNNALEPYRSPTGLPTEHIWWWHATRLINTLSYTLDPTGKVTAVNDRADYTISEFPFFSYLLGDMHPHVMALPFGLLALAFALSILRERDALDRAWVRRHPASIVLAALALGGLGFMNSWDFPTYTFVFVVALVAGQAIARGGLQPSVLRELASVVLAVGGAGVALYLPFYVGFQSQVSGVLPVLGPGTRPIHYFIFWGPLLVPVLGLLAVFASGRWPRLRRQIGLLPWATLPALIPLAVWWLVSVGAGMYVGTSTDVVGRTLTMLPLVGLITLASWLLLHLVAQPVDAPVEAQPTAALRAGPETPPKDTTVRRARPGQPDRTPAIFGLILAGTGLLLTLGPELFFIKDVFGTRMNTVFKLYYQAWVLLAIAATFGVYYVHSRWQTSAGVMRTAGVAWYGLLAVLLIGGLAYPIASLNTKTNGLAGPPTLDGLAYVRLTNPSEYEAIRWLNDNVDAAAVVLEATGPQYSEYGRVSARTGLPTILGWAGHESQWRGSDRLYRGRDQEIDQMFQTQDRGLLDKYQVAYVYAGALERSKYGAAVDRFGSLGEVVFKNQGVTIYRIKREGADSAA